MIPITQNITNIIQQYTTGALRATVMGGGLAYACSNEFYHHTPLVFLNPYAYAGYQVYVSQSDVVKWYKQKVKELTKI